MPSTTAFNSPPAERVERVVSIGAVDPRGVLGSGGYSPEVYDLLLDAGARLAAYYAARARRARNLAERNRWQSKLGALREEVAAVDAESNASVVGKRNELLERYRKEARVGEDRHPALGAG